jgi:hypothetical protein
MTVAGKPYAHLTDAELGAASNVIATGTTESLFVIPWWMGGYSKCFMIIPLQLANTGIIQLLAQPLGSNGLAMNSFQFELLQGGSLSAGDESLMLNFDDGILPGSYSIGSIAGASPAVGLTTNPVWTKAPFLEFLLTNNTGGNVVTLAGFHILLGS